MKRDFLQGCRPAALLSAQALFFSSVAIAAPESEAIIHQQERQRALEKQLQPATPDVRLSPPATGSSRLHFPDENPCFPLQRILLKGKEDFPHWLPLQRLANQASGRCLGAQGINLLMSALQNLLIDRGYVTSRVLAPAQDLTQGSLTLQLFAGKASAVSLTPQSGRYVNLWTALPTRVGTLFDLRDVEQGLENLQRLPTVTAEMSLSPGAKPGESDVSIDWQQRKMWRLGASLDDAGATSTGRIQGGVTFYLDNPLSLSDLFYVSVSHDLARGADKNSKNLTGHYSVPFGYWQLGMTASKYRYLQTVAGRYADVRYSGVSQSLNGQLSRVLHRTGSQKTTFSWDLLTRQTRSYLDDTEIGVQRSHTSAWRLGLQHRHYIGAATLDAGISYQRGTRWFGAIPAPSEAWGEGTALAKILQLNGQFSVPFTLSAQRFSFTSQYLRQMSSTPLTPQDRFSIGSRWTVRGFDGERSLSADSGWTVRNDIGWATPVPAQQLYLAVDYGETGSRGSDLQGRHLAGGAVGLRGSALNTGYDLFAGVPLAKPAGYHTSGASFGFNLSWNY